MHSIFELFKVGIGPSSSHTVGPMIAAKRFVDELLLIPAISEIANSADKKPCMKVDLFGSLALTGKGHATDRAVLWGLSGLHPATATTAELQSVLSELEHHGKLRLGKQFEVGFSSKEDIVFHFDRSLPFHPNGLTFSAKVGDTTLLTRTFYSIGGGFVLRDDETGGSIASTMRNPVPFDFTSADELLSLCRTHSCTIEEIVHRNERVARTDKEIEEGLDRLWNVMEDCIHRGCRNEGVLPGGLEVKRRAPSIARRLEQEPVADDPLRQLDWVSLFALAVNEENAAGGQVVTAPTNGAAGIIPAVLAYYCRFYPQADRAGIHRFLKTAGAIGLLYKRNASLSAAEMGCQGEVGVACSMAAGGLAACMGGTPEQIENAAEIGMEHNLGLTCDPVRGLVQVPCIERNTMGATKAINAARLAVLYGDGTHRVSLDRVIETMRQTGVDMQSKYKETSLGGLAVNVVNC